MRRDRASDDEGWALAEGPIGAIALHWRRDARGLHGLEVLLPPHRQPAVGRDAEAQALAEGLARGAGLPAARRRRWFAAAALTPFSRLVLETLAARVPAGKVVSYGGLAELCGRPGAARAVAGVMSRNRFPLLCPCHRVISGTGTIGGFQSRRPGGQARKRRLLEAEGIRFRGARIDPACILA